MAKVKGSTLQEKIDYLEEQKELLISARKDELANIIIKAGGLALDSRLIAGFVSYAAKADRKDNEILKQMLEVGKSLKLPRRKTKQGKK